MLGLRLLIITVPVVYMARVVMILMRAIFFSRAIGRVGPEMRLFWALKWQRAKPLYGTIKKSTALNKAHNIHKIGSLIRKCNRLQRLRGSRSS